MFTRTQKYQSSTPKEDLRSRLVGHHVKIHNMDFEVYEKEQSLRIIPHAEQEQGIKTLPITKVEMRQDGDKMSVVVTSKMRRLDAGGPLLIVTFCTFMVIAAIILMLVGGELRIAYALLGIASCIMTIFFVRMQMGYFDYVRKIRSYVQSNLDAI